MEEIKNIIDLIAGNIERNPEKLKFSHDLKLAKMHPKGEEAYFNELKFDIHKKLNNNVIGHSWIDNDSPDPLKINEENGNTWIETFVNNWIQWDCIKHITEDGFLKELKDENYQIIGNVRKELWDKYKNQYSSEIKSFLQEYFYIEMINNHLNSTKIQTPIIEIPILKDNSELKQKAHDLLIVLNGNWLNGIKIMSDDEYKKLVQGVFDVIDKKEVKPIQSKISTQAPLKFIRKLFRELNNDLYGKPINDSFIDLLHGYFECFGNTEKEVTKSHFNEYRNSSFDSDYKKVLETINK